MNLQPLLKPNSIAIVGASRDPQKIGAQILSNLLKSEFQGKLFPINPKAELIQGLDSYISINKIDEPIDLVIIAIPQFAVESVVDECISKKVGSIIIISAGFKEVGAEGKKSEDTIRDKCSKAGIPVLGPNCLGLINPSHKLNASFTAEMPKDGNIAFYSQSGAFGTAAIDWATNHSIGFNIFASLGNKAVLNENHFLEATPSNTKVIAMYLEDVSNGQKFMDISHEISKKTPIILLKPGKTEKAQIAVKSHTGALAASDEIITAACTKSGVIRVDTIEEMFTLMKTYSYLPKLKGNRIAVITNAGGPGIITTDAIESSGLQLAPISQAAQDALSQYLPREANIHDPIDLIGDAKSDRYDHAMDIVLNEETVDACIVILTPQSSTEIELTTKSIINHAKKYSKPILCAFLGGSMVKEAVTKLNENKIPAFYYPEQAVQALSKIWWHTNWQSKQNNNISSHNKTHIESTQVQRIISNAKSQNRVQLMQDEVEQILTNEGVKFPKKINVTSAKEAIKQAELIGTPVVMKISAENIIHKTDSGAVALNLIDEDEISDAFIRLDKILQKNASKNSKDSIYIQQQIPSGTELIIGAKRDPAFGPVVLFGTGGTNTEIYNDVAFQIAPLTTNQIQEMIETTKIYKILKGYRTGKIADIEYLIRIISALGNIISANDSIDSIEINPLVITDVSTVALDARILLK